MDQATELMRDVITHGIRYVDRRRTGIYHRLDDTAQEIGFRTTGIFR